MHSAILTLVLASPQPATTAGSGDHRTARLASADSNATDFTA